MNTTPTALNAYLARTAAIHAKLARLQQLADDHFGHDPDAINWGHVGDLSRVESAINVGSKSMRGICCRLQASSVPKGKGQKV